MLATLPLLQDTDFPKLYRDQLTTLQVNVGYVCNQQCLHCHVNAGPKRTETMTAETYQLILNFLQHTPSIQTLDLTGGAPELCPYFRELVQVARERGLRVMDRCNLTVLTEPSQQDLAAFLAAHQVEVIASLPCYLAENVDKQRGRGVFQRSIEGLQQLNALGYGQPDSGLSLSLVFNPQDASLPPPQAALETDYRQFLGTHYGIVFNQLLTLCNMPVQRFGSWLLSTGRFNQYLTLLKNAYREENLRQVMCRSLLSVDWQGYVYDCDFNQMLGLTRANGDHLSQLLGQDLQNSSIVVGEHCYGCTAGQGSSCGGALS